MRLLLTLLFAFSISATNYTISSFNTSKTGFPVLDNAIITSTRTDGELTVLKQAPSKFKNGQLVMRVRFGLNNYTLYSGNINKDTYKNLSAFRLPAGVSYGRALKLKFYDADNKLEAQDMAKVYFDGSLVYTDNDNKLYYNKNGSWVKLNALDELPGRLEINSIPSGCIVSIDGVRKGTTPLSFVMDAPTVEVEVSKSGYYSQSFTARCTIGSVHLVSPKLNKKVNIVATTDPLVMVDTMMTEISDVEARIKAIVKAESTAKEQEKTMLANFERTYPILKPRDEFELRDEFTARKASYDSKKATERAKIKVDEKAFNRSKRLMEAHLNELDAKMYSLYLPVNSMKLGKYDIDKFEFPLNIKVKQGPFDFTFDGKLPIPRDAARKFKSSSSQKALRVTYGKRGVIVTQNGKSQQKYFKYGMLELPFEGKVYELKGNIILPSAVIKSRQVKAYQNKLANKERLEKESLKKELFAGANVKNTSEVINALTFIERGSVPDVGRLIKLLDKETIETAIIVAYDAAQNALKKGHFLIAAKLYTEVGNLLIVLDTFNRNAIIKKMESKYEPLTINDWKIMGGILKYGDFAHIAMTRASLQKESPSIKIKIDKLATKHVNKPISKVYALANMM